jgi:hypothetical protein
MEMRLWHWLVAGPGILLLLIGLFAKPAPPRHAVGEAAPDIRGQTVVLKEDSLLCETQVIMDEIAKVQRRSDDPWNEPLIMVLRLHDKFCKVDRGTRALVILDLTHRLKVRLLDGENKGRVGWISWDPVRP